MGLGRGIFSSVRVGEGLPCPGPDLLPSLFQFTLYYGLFADEARKANEERNFPNKLVNLAFYLNSISLHAAYDV